MIIIKREQDIDDLIYSDEEYSISNRCLTRWWTSAIPLSTRASGARASRINW